MSVTGWNVALGPPGTVSYGPAVRPWSPTFPACCVLLLLFYTLTSAKMTLATSWFHWSISQFCFTTSVFVMGTTIQYAKFLCLPRPHSKRI